MAVFVETLYKTDWPGMVLVLELEDYPGLEMPPPLFCFQQQLALLYWRLLEQHLRIVKNRLKYQILIQRLLHQYLQLSWMLSFFQTSNNKNLISLT